MNLIFYKRNLLNRILKGVAAMPVLQIEMVHGKTLEQKRVTVKELSELNGILTKRLVGLNWVKFKHLGGTK